MARVATNVATGTLLLPHLNFFIQISIQNTVKLLHGWAPTYAYLCRQGHHPSPLCPRCKTCVETNEHILQCSHPEASASRSCILLDSIDFL